MSAPVDWILDMDLARFFDTMPHREILAPGLLYPPAVRADDALALFEREDDAQRFLRVLPLRLGKFGLRLNAQKTRLLACGKRHAWQAFRARRRLPGFNFLGFTHYCGQSRTRKARLKRKTSKKRLRRALVELNRWLRQERNARKLPDL